MYLILWNSIILLSYVTWFYEIILLSYVLDSNLEDLYLGEKKMATCIRVVIL